MKKTAAIILLAIYLNAAAQPLLPWISDVLAHTFNWHDHLEQVHHGHVHSHHLGMEMAAAEQDNANHPATASAFFFNKDTLSTHMLSESPEFRLKTRQIRLLMTDNKHFFYSNIANEVLLPPPNLSRIVGIH